MRPWSLAMRLVVCMVLVACTTTAPIATPAEPTSSPTPATSSAVPSTSITAAPTRIAEPPTSSGLRESVTSADIRRHLEELQRLADAGGGTRATGTPGFDMSVEYVSAQLVAAGYDVERQPFLVAGQASVNLLVERQGAIDEIVMVGAHLDSVIAGPGINDNGSGVATLLVLAQRLAELPPPSRTIRLAFWGAEEGGPFGSDAYVDSLVPAERDRIGAYLNFDMLGSPNFIRFVYDEPSAAEGSDAITAVFSEYFEDARLAWEPIDLSGHSDHGAFLAAGIPTGGLFSGGREPKTDAQAAAFGGAAGAPADACSDAACDTIGNVNELILDEMADAVAHAVATLAGAP